jgi:hypothetical protein
LVVDPKRVQPFAIPVRSGGPQGRLDYLIVGGSAKRRVPPTEGGFFSVPVGVREPLGAS